MISLQDVRIDVSGTTLLNDLSFSIEPGETVVIGGPTGSGKSTVLRTIAGVHPVASGNVAVDGVELDHRTVRSVRQRIAYVDQEPVLAAGPAREALLLPFSFAANRSRVPDDVEIDAALERVGLGTQILSKDTQVLSGGEKQRLAVARALLLGRPIMLMDEVTSALDEGSALEMLQIVQSLPQTILTVSHHPEWLRAIDRRLSVIDGTVVEA